MVMSPGPVSVLAVVLLSNLQVNQIRDGLQDVAVPRNGGSRRYLMGGGPGTIQGLPDPPGPAGLRW